MLLKISQSLCLGFGLISSSALFAAVKEYHLVIDESPINLTGKTVKRITVNGKFPAPLLEFEEGDDAVIHVQNNLNNQDTSLHWHGLLLPGLMDGVPGFNGFQGIKPKQSFTYRFKVRQNGTYWYHAHSKGQEQDGLYGALVIRPKAQTLLPPHEQTERDYVVMLSDFHEQSGQQIQNNLKKSAEYYQNQRETLGDVLQQVKRDGLKATWSDRKMWNQMRMLKTDLSDVTGYTFLVNGKTPQQNWSGQFQPNEKVRLRFINASAMSFFDVRIPQLKMTVVSADGQPVQPVNVDEFRIGTAETYDVIVEPTAAHYQIEAESIDRSGFAIGSLHQATDSSKAPAPVQLPTPRPRALLTMEDMGHGEQHDMSHDTHSSQTMQTATSEHDQHAQHDMHVSHNAMSGTNQPHQPVEGWANMSTPAGHKALQYQDLKALTPQPDTRAAERELVIRLGGTMERYIWTMNGKKFSDAEPLQVKYGERIRLKFINDSMMAHPMHLHGMFMQLENGQSAANMPNKHTVIVPPGKTVTTLLTADELGEWAIHCHLLYHMSAGMMNKLIVAHVNDDQASHPSSQKMPSKPAAAEGASHAHH
ncbi:copper resistance system multicopper oxidase [Acinetobacter lwoffii]|uniref:copper resistance system multicopper oxidase n=1 Tax=Acinetobacter lwoffii TaxID=28090 RepID=UPI003F8D73A4